MQKFVIRVDVVGGIRDKKRRSLVIEQVGRVVDDLFLLSPPRLYHRCIQICSICGHRNGTSKIYPCPKLVGFTTEEFREANAVDYVADTEIAKQDPIH